MNSQQLQVSKCSITLTLTKWIYIVIHINCQAAEYILKFPVKSVIKWTCR